MIPAVDLPALRIGPLLVDASEAIAVLGVAAGALYARARAKARGLAVRRAVDGYFLLVAASLVFGHALDVLLYRREALRADPLLLLPWKDGYCSLGAFVGAGLAVIAFHRDGRGGRRLRWDEIDNLAAALPLAWGIGRVGCFLGRHHAGRRTDFLLAVAYDDGPRHDLGLYDALAGFAIFLLLGAVDRVRPRARPRAPGVLFAVAAIAYGAARFTIEHVRGEDLERIGRHSDPRFAGLTLVQYAAVLLVGIGVALGLRARRAP